MTITPTMTPALIVDYGRTEDGCMNVFVFDGTRWTFTITDASGEHVHTGTARSKVLAVVGATAARRFRELGHA